MENDIYIEKLKSLIDGFIFEKKIVGCSVIACLDGQIIHKSANGYADKEKKIPMNLDSIYRLASITKPIVTLAAMQLIEECKININDDISLFLPNFRPLLNNKKPPNITIHNLLTHTSGLSYKFREKIGSDYYLHNVSDGLDQPGLSIKENLKRLNNTKLRFLPGEKWNYSLSIDVLGAILEEVEGCSLDKIIEERITNPLNMKDTGFHIVDMSRLVTPYADNIPEPIAMNDGTKLIINYPDFNGEITFSPSRILDKKSYFSGGAGMASTAYDLLTFFELIRNGGGPIINHDTYSLMIKSHVGPEAETYGKGWGFGYGWAILDTEDKLLYPQSKGTLQWGGALGHLWFIDIKNKLTVIILTNTALSGGVGDFPTKITECIYSYIKNNIC